MIKQYLILLLCTLPIISYSSNPCDNEGGVNFCDSSSGRYVCVSGNYSTFYCTRHAIMDLEKIEGCCTWQGGVLRTSPNGQVICNDGGVAELCSLQHPIEQVASF